MYDLKIAVKCLEDEGLTMVVVKDGKVIYKSKEKGIKPVLSAALEGESRLKGCSAADTVVGKAAAMLYSFLGIDSLHAGLTSEDAVKFLECNNIYLEYDSCVQHILNRDHTDMCPMEKIAVTTGEPDTLIKKIQEFLALRKKP